MQRTHYSENHSTVDRASQQAFAFVWDGINCGHDRRISTSIVKDYQRDIIKTTLFCVWTIFLLRKELFTSTY